ncbi:alpha/beta hydrolase [Bailinhaonella thermotolerans]|uniref:Alpha/beta hydrolase n=1 Tax=Bailinhaonella thermotolerans TaxID=1070861 RepID=A0A3A4AP80_9ACTN|nr:alpha/beta hydrolase [Bailinhaonella thermotolerans]RJL30359.1 alpha/beta hydrolase [Bailinhaonella thermotolerans]
MTIPYGYLATLVPIAAATVFALAAPRGPRPLAALAFRLGVALNELPFLAAAYLLTATSLALAEGDLSSPVLAGAAAATTAGLGLVAWRGVRALPAVRRAMGPVPVSGRMPYARIALGPFLRRHRAVERIADLPYGPGGRRNLLDVHRHRSRPSGAPVLIHLHGGGYTAGRKNSQSLPLLRHLAGRGWVCVSANYRLRPDAGLEDHLIDAKRVIAWVREHGPAHGADPGRIFLAGSSAGAHMAALAALTPDDPALQPGFEEADTSVSAVIGLGGYYGPYYGRGQETSPVARVHPDAPPFFLAHGDRDTVVPAESARLFAGRLRAVSARPVVYAELPGGQHAFDLFDSARFHAVINGIEAFAARVVPSPGTVLRSPRP